MGKMHFNKYISAAVLLIAVICIVQPAMADNTTVTVAYRGAGGYNIGDPIVFDGINTAGDTTLLKITGPGLPTEGVPVYDLNGLSGSGNFVKVDPDGTWKFVWYTSTIKGVEKLKTARYTFIATDLEHPEKTAIATIYLKKPEFSVIATPNPANVSDYVQLIGNVEQGISYAKIEVTDSSGTVLHTFVSPVSASGYLGYGFHVDMPRGSYYVTVSNPSLNTPFRLVLNVGTPPPPTPVPVTSGAVPVVTTGVSDQQPVSSPTNVLPKSPFSLPLSPFTIIFAIMIPGILAILRLKGQKEH
jgi:hypothetical protein